MSHSTPLDHESEREPLLAVRDLHVKYPIKSKGVVRKTVGAIHAVNGVSFDLYQGETLGIVGESGCGKSSVARAVLRLGVPATGSVWFEGSDLLTMNSRDLREVRRRAQIVFQDPYSSLDPRMTVEEIISEPWSIHRIAFSRNDKARRIAELLDMVGLSGQMKHRYPHEFSGGQRQRIGLARALALEPTMIICDEAVSALDVSVQAQVLNLMSELQERLGVAYLFISHDLSVVAHLADRVAVMYLGEIVEYGTVDDLYHRPTHPYTQGLLSSAPVLYSEADKRRQSRRLGGDIRNAVEGNAGCRFADRCWKAHENCLTEHPELLRREPHGQMSRCFYANSNADSREAG